MRINAFKKFPNLIM